jgi:RNA polymerase primary sigma factor
MNLFMVAQRYTSYRQDSVFSDSEALSRLLAPNSKFVEKYVKNRDFEAPRSTIERWLFKSLPLDLDLDEVERSWDALYLSMSGVKDVEEEVLSSRPLFTTNEEITAFLRLNYAKFRIYDLQRINKKKALKDSQLESLLRWYRTYEELRKMILLANLGLISKMLRPWKIENRHRKLEIMTECQFALLRSLEKFNISFGWKFSTYACSSIKKQIIRSVKKETKNEALSYEEDQASTSERESLSEDNTLNLQVEDLRRILNGEVQHSVDPIKDIELKIVNWRFGLSKISERNRSTKKRILGPKTTGGATLEEIGRELNITKERVRQLQNRALEKMWGIMEDEYLVPA